MLDEEEVEPEAETFALDPPQRALLVAAVGEARPDLEPELGGQVHFVVVEQPFFRRYRIISMTTSATQLHVARGEEGDLHLLTGDLDAFNALAALDPPGLLLDRAAAYAYGVSCEVWTDQRLPVGRTIQAFDAIELPSELSPTESRVMEAIRGRLDSQITAPRMVQVGERQFVLDRWLVAERQLVRRRLELESSGRVSFRQDIVAASLPLASR